MTNQCDFCSDFIEKNDIEKTINDRMLNGRLYCESCWNKEIQGIKQLNTIDYRNKIWSIVEKLEKQYSANMAIVILNDIIHELNKNE